MSKVYVCAGSCHGQSDQPGACQAASCERVHQPLELKEKCDQCGAIYSVGETHTCQ